MRLIDHGKSDTGEIQAGAAVYRIFDGLQTIYVGKGSGRRLAQQCARFRCAGEIIEKFESESEAYRRERFWISVLMPTENRHPGGTGARAQRSKQSRKSRIEREIEAEMAEIGRVGSRKYVAKFLLRRASHLLSRDDLMDLQRVAAS